MSLLQLKNASIILGHPPLLNGIELVIHPGERLCLVGRNGCGKSTLLKVIEADIKLDDGQRLVNKEVKISRLPQDPPASVQCSLFDYVAEGLMAMRLCDNGGPAVAQVLYKCMPARRRRRKI